MPQYLFRDSPPEPLHVSSASGSYVTDKFGKRYLDFRMGWCIGNAGWNCAELMSAIHDFNGPVFVPQHVQYGKWDVLAEKLVSLMPDKDYSCFRATGGTEAVELSLKIARAYNARQKFVAFKNAYHGQSYAAMALVGLHEDRFGPYGDNYTRLNITPNASDNDWDRETEQAVNTILEGNVCAFISEPIICNLAVTVPPKSFFRKVRKACSETQTMFIMDEVMTGFGRTGKSFGFEHYDLKPDIVTIAKGFSSGHAPIGAAIARSEVAESMRFDFSNYSSFGWHPLAVEAAIANIDYMHKNSLVEKSAGSGAFLSKKLSEFAKPQGKGLCIGFDAPPSISQKCFDSGLIVGDWGSRITLYPPLTVALGELDEAVRIIRENFGKK